MQSELIRFGSRLVYECGLRLADKRRNEEMFITEKNGYSDIVTDHDIWVQQFLFERIMEKYPSHRFMGEETLSGLCTDKGEESPWLWVVDPIDGTSNYSSMGRNFAISVALMEQEKIVCGWVYDVMAGIFYEGVGGENGFRMEYTEGKCRKEECLLYMGHKTMMDLDLAGENPWELCGEFLGVRYDGCASLELCRLSEMKNGAYLNSHLKLWDFAAAAAVLAERGYTVKAARMGDEKYFVCAYGSEEVYRICEKYFPGKVRENMQPVIERADKKGRYAEIC